MLLLTLRNLCLSFGPMEVLLENASLTIDTKERICLIGRNGAGKSSLLKLIQGDLLCDSGEVERAPYLTIAKLMQEIPRDLEGTVFEVVSRGFGEDLQPWEIEHKVEALLSKMDLDPLQEVSTLSGGYIRRVLMAQAILAEPDILLLDEPTNHLDITTIAWLEDFLLKYNKTVLFITHDRLLLDKIATRIVEVDHGQLVSWKGNYTDYLAHKESQLAAESKRNDLFDKRLADEERWVRQGVKARRTRNEGRVRQLEAMRVERQARRDRVGVVNMQAQSVDSSGKLVFELDHITHCYDDKTVIDDFSSVVMRGDKIGIIGGNGAGKSTLLKILLGQLVPTKGMVRQGTRLNICYFDQQREQLDDSKSIVDNISDSCDFVMINGKSVHVMTYLNDFLFSPARARMSTKVLSGGERHRLLLARLFTRASNVLILDEPTNDLDMETLELLETRLVEYEGTLILVSHDRSFLNNIVTSTWALEGQGSVQEYIGGYDDYLRQRSKKSKNKEQKQSVMEKVPLDLTAKEKNELEKIPKKIEQLEAERDRLYGIMADLSFYQKNQNETQTIHDRLKIIEEELVILYQRWGFLE